MHKKLKEILPQAAGTSEFVVAIFIDVRGFTNFVGTAESINGALFLKKIYLKFLEYFADISFFKLTGDGMMIIRTYTEENFLEILDDSLRRCLDLVDDFPKFTHGDTMINFPVPKEIGIGMARASATKLSSGETVLDYSGRPLNLAARLMDQARPSGVVFGTENIGISNIHPDLLKQFSEDNIYLKGIAVDKPISIHFQKLLVKIENSSRIPIGKFQTVVEVSEVWTFAEMKTRPIFVFFLPRKPDIEDSCKIHISVPSVMTDGAPDPEISTFHDYPVEYVERGGRPAAQFNFDWAIKIIEKSGVKPDWKINLDLSYQVIDTSR